RSASAATRQPASATASIAGAFPGCALRRRNQLATLACGSMSRIATRRPQLAKVSARWIASVVLPAPPFCCAMVMIVAAMFASGRKARLYLAVQHRGEPRDESFECRRDRSRRRAPAPRRAGRVPDRDRLWLGRRCDQRGRRGGDLQREGKTALQSFDYTYFKFGSGRAFGARRCPRGAVDAALLAGTAEPRLEARAVLRRLAAGERGP